MAVREELYRYRPPASLKVPILVHPAAVNYDAPMEKEAELEVRRMKGGREGGTSGMRAEDLKWWRKEANQEKDLECRRW